MHPGPSRFCPKFLRAYSSVQSRPRRQGHRGGKAHDDATRNTKSKNRFRRLLIPGRIGVQPRPVVYQAAQATRTGVTKGAISIAAHSSPTDPRPSGMPSKLAVERLSVVDGGARPGALLGTSFGPSNLFAPRYVKENRARFPAERVAWAGGRRIRRRASTQAAGTPSHGKCRCPLSREGSVSFRLAASGPGGGPGP